MSAQPTLGVDPTAVHSSPEFEVGTLATGLGDPSKSFRYCRFDPNAGSALTEGGGSDPASTKVVVGHHDSPWTVRDKTTGDTAAGVPWNGSDVAAGSYFWVQVDGSVVLTDGGVVEGEIGYAVNTIADTYVVSPGSDLA